MPREVSPIEGGYWLSSEEHGPKELVAHAVRAEQAGFRAAMISDHFHPWARAQGRARGRDRRRDDRRRAIAANSGGLRSCRGKRQATRRAAARVLGAGRGGGARHRASLLAEWRIEGRRAHGPRSSEGLRDRARAR